jgi:spermidine synthase
MALSQLRVAKTVTAAAAALLAIVSARALAAPGNGAYTFDSPYQSIRIIEEGNQRILIMGGSRSSGIYSDTGDTSFEYVQAAEKALDPIKPETVLVIGAAGFTLPRDVARRAEVKRIDAVDVDPAVRDIAERYFLKQKLPDKVRFLPLSARYAVRKLHADGARYGFTFVDAYFGKGIPDELVTVEFFRDVRLVSEHTAANVVMDSEMESAFARNLLASFREAFGRVWVKKVKSGDDDLTNILVTDFPVEGAFAWNESGDAYRDDRNSADRDHVKMVW